MNSVAKIRKFFVMISYFRHDTNGTPAYAEEVLREFPTEKLKGNSDIAEERIDLKAVALWWLDLQRNGERLPGLPKTYSDWHGPVLLECEDRKYLIQMRL
jgi:hypothetical protein